MTDILINALINNMDIIYEDENFVVLNKPAGMLVHRTPKNESEKTVAGRLIKKYPEISKVGDKPEVRPGIIHRLDKETSGILMVAKNQDFFDYIKNLFQKRKVKKEYYAVVWGKLPKKGIIDKDIGLVPGGVRRSTEAKNMKMIKTAVTKYKSEKYFSQKGKEFTFAKIYPQTGRTHQIRVHLASINHPVVGDKLYGGRKRKQLTPRHLLHAYSLGFNLPEGKRIKLEAELPQDIKDFIRK